MRKKQRKASHFPTAIKGTEGKQRRKIKPYFSIFSSVLSKGDNKIGVCPSRKDCLTNSTWQLFSSNCMQMGKPGLNVVVENSSRIYA